jgi:4-hydroxy-tetrahydrodipicolinate reductase
MGGRLAHLVSESEDLTLAGGTERAGHAAIGEDVSAVLGGEATGMRVTDDLSRIIERGDVVIDFTAPVATVEAARICGEAGKAMVVGTTGWSAEQRSQFEEAVKEIPCVLAPNYSVGVNVLFKLVEEAARILGDEYDVEIVEAHHRFKKDAPSGTALGLAEIGIHAIRAGDIVGEHTVLFGGMGERIELVHRAQSRDTFAQGALRAARFVAKAPPGLYDMGDVLGIK